MLSVWMVLMVVGTTAEIAINIVNMISTINSIISHHANCFEAVFQTNA